MTHLQTLTCQVRIETHDPNLSLVYLATNMNCSDQRVSHISSALRMNKVAMLCDQKQLLQRTGHDNFFASLVEQELCARAKGFVGSKYSTWTDTVRGMRSHSGRAASLSFEELWVKGLA